MRFLSSLYLLLSSCFSYAQEINENLIFTRYLVQNEMYDESRLLLRQVQKHFILNQSQQDSVNYFIGKSHFFENPDSSLHYFKKITPVSSLYTESCLYNSFLYASSKSFEESEKLLNSLSDTTELRDVRDLFKESVEILQNEIHFQDSKSRKRPESGLSNQFEMLETSKMKLQKVKAKSPAVAGLLSAVIPGSGRIYAGKPKQGIASFFPVALLGAQAYEGYSKGGVKSPAFIIYSSLFSIFYIGNIWGSALSVHINKQEIYDEVHHEVIAVMQIPVDRLFYSRK